MAEERWHDFAKEKPSEDMEGRNFIVSNGHYEKIATWCGYWENEPFMGDRLCDEVVRWKDYLTPEEEKANEATCKELFVEESYNGGKYYDKDAVDALLAEKDKDIAYWRKEYDEETKLTDALKAEIESLKASHYADMVDAGMRERRLRRVLWLTRTAMAKSEKDRWNAHVDCGNRRNRKDPSYVKTGKLLEVSEWRKLWADNERKCRAKAEEYK